MKNIAVPLKLVKILSDGQFHSGQQLGQELGMSRAAINKHMQVLRDWGLDIFTVTGKGYSLSQSIQLLEQDKILSHLPSGQLTVLSVTNSTNQYLMEHIEDLQSGDACVAEYQQAGRGRRGRQWFSPFGANLYLSMYWRLEQGPAAAAGLSLVVGIVMAEVLQKLGADKVKVKWPNDLYMNDKKLAGILVELSGKAGDSANVIIGAGINLLMKEPDANIVNQAWANLQESGLQIDRNELVIELVTALRQSLQLFEVEGLNAFIDRWQPLDNFLDRRVKLLIGDKEIFGIARGIDEQGALRLEIDGVIKTFIGGEISLRPAN